MLDMLAWQNGLCNGLQNRKRAKSRMWVQIPPPTLYGRYYPLKSEWVFYKTGVEAEPGYEKVSETAIFFTRLGRDRNLK